MDKKYIYTLLIVAVILSVFFVMQYKRTSGVRYFHEEGLIFGTIYSIKYQYSESIKDTIEVELKKVDSVFSAFNPNSVISRINRNDTTVVLNDWFIKLFKKSEEVSQESDGAFDITVAPLVNAWGFGFRKSEDEVNQSVIDSLLKIVGYKTVHLENNRIVKENKQTMLDASAVAKGYACDIITTLLEAKGIKNYLVEIGGELRAGGVNQKGECWAIGIKEPTENSGNREFIRQKIRLCEGGLATSGNYSNFYYKNGKKYAHTIHPKTGYPELNNLLSVSVIAPDCMTADAYATAFMVSGVEKSKEILQRHPELHVYLIYLSEKNNLQVFYTEGFKKYLI